MPKGLDPKHFGLASLGSALAPSVGWLMVCRVLQALGGSAGMVIPRAVVRDVVGPEGMARAFARLMLVMGLAPILAPLLGGWMLGAFDWRSIFLGLAALGLALMGAAWWALPETRPEGSPRAVGRAFMAYGAILGDRRFLGYALAGGLAFSGVMAYLAASPFVFIDLHQVAPSTYALIFGTNAMGLIGAAQLNHRLLAWRSADALLSWALLVALAAALWLLVAALTGWGGLLGLWLPLFLITSSVGFVGPNAGAGAMSGPAQRAGAASAMMGGLQAGLGALAGAAVGWLEDGSAGPMAVVLLVCVALAWPAHRFLRGGVQQMFKEA